MFVGVDIQTTGVAFGITPTNETGWIPLPKYASKMPHRKRYARLAFLYEIHEQYPFNTGPTAVYVENPMGMSRGAQSPLNQVLGVFVASLTVANIPVIMINTSTWKDKIFAPKSKGVPAEKRGKDEILVKATAITGQVYDPKKLGEQDQADALLISRAGALRWNQGLDTWDRV